MLREDVLAILRGIFEGVFRQITKWLLRYRRWSLAKWIVQFSSLLSWGLAKWIVQLGSLLRRICKRILRGDLIIAEINPWFVALLNFISIFLKTQRHLIFTLLLSQYHIFVLRIHCFRFFLCPIRIYFANFLSKWYPVVNIRPIATSRMWMVSYPFFHLI